jgi:hypothetical protein
MTPILSKRPAPDNGPLLDEALSYADRGWSIIAVIEKRAASLWKPFQNAPADEHTLRRLFARTGVTGFAVITGRVSGGLAVRDFDKADNYRAWREAHRDDADRLPTVRTPNGFHVYGHLGAEDYITLFDGELRADSRHYCLLPPSLHPDGDTYTWAVSLPPVGTILPTLPPSLFEAPLKQTQAYPANPLHVLTTPGDDEIQAAIAVTLPTGPGQRNRRLFDLARLLKGLIPDASPVHLREFVRQWHRLALPTIRTKEFSETWADFIIAWGNVKRPVGQSFRAASEVADHTMPAVAYRYNGHLRRLVSLCWHLQGQWQGRPFPLSCRKAGAYLHSSHIFAWKLLKVLEFDGLLTLVAKGSKRSAKASEWRFIDKEQGGTGQ